MVTKDAENLTTVQPEKRWIVDLEWFEKNNRSFIDFARRSLCGKCAEKLQKKKKKVSVEEVMAAVKDCCSKAPEYITGKLPTLESVFRILLANGNQPMGVNEINKELSLRRGGDAYTVSPQALNRLLSNDRWYGFKQAAEGENAQDN